MKITMLLSSLTLAVMVGTSMAAVKQHTFATELQEVRTGSVNGKEYLTIYIDGNVGPAACHGNVLKIDTASISRLDQQEEIEAVALSAMLTSESVMITVPLESSRCVDGLPTLTDMYLLPHSP